MAMQLRLSDCSAGAVGRIFQLKNFKSQISDSRPDSWLLVGFSNSAVTRKISGTRRF
jgi:hypothetical protein